MTEPTPCLTGDLRTPGKRRAPQKHRRALTAAAPGSMPSPNYSSRNGATVTGIAIHSAEGPLTAVALGNYFDQASSQVSSHAGADDGQVIAYVDPKFEAWTIRNGNPWTDNIEMCAFAAWTRAQWLAHPGMLQQTANWVAARCHARNIPPRQISATDIAAGRRTGYFAHWDYTRGTGDGTHWDVGSNFPWDVFNGLVQAAYNGTPQEDDMTPDQAQQLKDLHDRLGKFDLAAWAILGGGGQSGIRDLLGSVLAQEAKQADPTALAAALAPLLAGALQGQGALTETDIETALRNVLGSLDNHS